MSREGLPPNTRVTSFDNRVVTMHWDCAHLSNLYLVTWGHLRRWEDDPYHRGTKGPRGKFIGRIRTDDETEAQVAYEKGAAWVLTGEGP